MKVLLTLSRIIDAVTERVGRAVMWLVLLMAIISAGNAVVRKAFNTSSNAFLEIQWYLFSALFLLCAGYTLLRNEHVRIDVISGRFSDRGRTWIDLFGLVFFLMPMVVVMGGLAIPYFYNGWVSGEVSSNAGGLVRWPVYLMIPVGFALLGLQGLSEIIKRIGFLSGHGPDPTHKPKEKTTEETLAESICQRREIS